jgi:phosphoribosyl 1,2-cyclic phosphodiesterase
VQVTFYGVRGSTPCPHEDNRRYGGNTSCVVVESPGHDPIILDLGTGLRLYGDALPVGEVFRGHALLTHVHWDHVQGLPFFTPVLRPGAELAVYGPPPDPPGTHTLAECFEQFICPPLFPVRVADLPGRIDFHTVRDAELAVGDAKVKVRNVPHTGVTNGYRIELDGATVVYISDHQMPLDGSHGIADSVLELCDGADLLIHDAQYTPEEFAQKRDWGHCTMEYAVHVASEAGVRRLALFHHDPTHGDDFVDCLVEQARVLAGPRVEEVLAAAEGLTIVL